MMPKGPKNRRCDTHSLHSLSIPTPTSWFRVPKRRYYWRQHRWWLGAVAKQELVLLWDLTQPVLHFPPFLTHLHGMQSISGTVVAKIAFTICNINHIPFLPQNKQPVNKSTKRRMVSTSACLPLEQIFLTRFKYSTFGLQVCYFALTALEIISMTD